MKASRWSRDDGVSLSELLVTMFLTAIVGTIVIGFFVAFTNTFTEDRAATDSATTAALGMNDMTRIIRSGTEIPVLNSVLNRPVFEEIGNERMTIHAFVDTDSADPRPIKITFAVNPDRELVECRYAAIPRPGGYWEFPATQQNCDGRVIARQLPARQAGQPALFTYYTAAGATVTIPNDGVTTDAQRSQIASVRINLTVQADITSRAEPVTLRNTVGIPNLGISRLGL